MNLKIAIPAIATSLLLAGAAVADDQQGRKNKNRNQNGSSVNAASAAIGGAEANRRGASAVGGAGSQVEAQRTGRRGQAVEGNTASTTGAGAIYTDRRTASGAVTTSGTASGTGQQQTSSQVEAYGETTRQGSNADVYGNSTAQTRQPRPR